MVPVLKNMQGHPKAPCQWHIHIHTIMKEYILKATTHVLCLYTQQTSEGPTLVLFQVDYFVISSKNKSIHDNICDSLDNNLIEPMT